MLEAMKREIIDALDAIDALQGWPKVLIIRRALPKKLAVGEEFSVFLIPDHDDLATGIRPDIGFTDSFGKHHWAPRRDMIDTLPKIRAACERSGKNWRQRRQNQGAR